MKKCLTLVFTILIGLLCGCLSNNNANDAIFIQTVNALNVDAVECGALVGQTACEAVISSKDNIAMPLSFDISDKTYCLGMVCEKMLSDFEIVEIVGYQFDDGYVPIGGQVTLTLCDQNSNNFTVTVHNQMNKAVRLEDCIVCEIVVENANVRDLSIIKVVGVVNGNSSLGCWIIALGDHYAENVESYWTSYCWDVQDSCFVEICIESNTDEVMSVRLATN